ARPCGFPRPDSPDVQSSNRQTSVNLPWARPRSLAVPLSRAKPARSRPGSHPPADRMNILLLGSGGREHALAWKIAASPLTARLFCAPGNAGIAQEAECVALDITDHQAVIAFCRANKIDFVVVGPEAPLVAGIVDDLEAAGIKTFGPSKAAAQLE